MGRGTRKDEEQISPRWRRCRSSGSAVVEFALVALIFLSIIFVSLNFFFWVFAKAALHSAVREGARYRDHRPDHAAVWDRTTRSGRWSRITPSGC